MSQALYRKYRSKNLGEIVGQAHVTDVLEQALTKGIISHAYLLTGPRGVGKTSIARILAHQLNNIPYEDDDTHLDIIEIDAASNRRIDDIRELREQVHIAPAVSKYKVYIIDEVHMLTNESFNALLKTLEEPPEHVIFILATTDFDKLPATIVSRTQRFHFRLIDQPTMQGHLKTIAKNEKIDIEDDALALLAQLSQGSFRDGINLLDQVRVLHSGKAISRNNIEVALGLASEDIIENLVTTVRAKDAKSLITILDQVESSGVAAPTLVSQLIEGIRKQLPASLDLIPYIGGLLEVGRSTAPYIKLLSVLVTPMLSSTSPQNSQIAALAVKAPTISAPVATLKAEIKKAATPPDPAREVTSPATNTPSVETTATITSVASDRPQIPFDWAALMTLTHDKYIMLFSVLEKCGHEFDGECLSVFTKFKLHATKLEDAKYRTMLQNALTEAFNDSISVKIAFGQPIRDAAALEVAALMGGGEAVDVS